MNTGQNLYKRAKEIIPGGNQLLSKRPEMFLPEKWPAYYKKAKGVEVWDLDNNKYLDMCIMAIGTSPLGYANSDISKAVKKAIDNGCVSSLNSYEEVELAEKLIDLHPYMEMARFARTGGEADAVAVRIARAASGKSKVAICGYHGWHDWYLATNLDNSGNLNDLLLPGLQPSGVPDHLKNSNFPFHYGNIEELEKIVNLHGEELGVVVVEVQRLKHADIPFLKKVQKIAKKNKSVLIFDEVSSSFRLSIGALYKLYDLEPDIVVIGKALGNGHPITAILGKRDVMEAAQGSFISSTYWTERVGFVAALETINQFEKHNVIEYLKMIGAYLDNGLTKIFQNLNLSIRNIGMITVPIIAIEESDPLIFKTIFTQEMLKNGILASNVIYLSYAHTKQIIDKYLLETQRVLENIKLAQNQGTLETLLEGPICHSGFSRLT
ncbi:MAG: aminotransferase class III-fold pyridoxal phosphate-dependent enzyme [Bacteroidales bacterium]|nr:aminotransferase class III-fold pyridoxal phosphate-dependent enzyme [Bacteroidales bacterium]